MDGVEEPVLTAHEFDASAQYIQSLTLVDFLEVERCLDGPLSPSVESLDRLNGIVVAKEILRDHPILKGLLAGIPLVETPIWRLSFKAITAVELLGSAYGGALYRIERGNQNIVWEFGPEPDERSRQLSESERRYAWVIRNGFAAIKRWGIHEPRHAMEGR
jgi:hypothetical protein